MTPICIFIGKRGSVMGILIILLIALLIAHRIVSSIDKKSQQSNNGIRRKDNSPHTVSKKKWMPEGVRFQLQITDLYDWTLSNCDEIKFKKKIRYRGRDYCGFAYLGNHRVIEIKWLEDGKSKVNQEICEIEMAATVCHECGHQYAYRQWGERSEKYAEEMAMEFLRRLRSQLKDRPYRILIPGRNGAPYSIVMNQSAVNQSYSSF